MVATNAISLRTHEPKKDVSQIPFQPPRLEILDYARFVAAISVALYHYSYGGIESGKITSIEHRIDDFKYGYLGVNFFFMISGYVILNSAQRGDAAKFAASRALRLYPAYWIAVIFTAFASALWGGERMAVSFTTVVINLSMLQHLFGVPDVDGVYWTLRYEICFYFFTFLALLFGLRSHLPKLIVAWPFALILSRVTGLRYPDILSDGYYLYFAAGALFAIISQRLTILRFASLMATASMCIYNASAGLKSPVIGCITTGFFLLFFTFQFETVRTLKLPGSRWLGAITYPIYLIHAHFGYMMLNIFAEDNNKLFVSTALLVVVLSIALLIHILVEKRAASFWKAFFVLTVERPAEFIKKLVYLGCIRIVAFVR